MTSLLHKNLSALQPKACSRAPSRTPSRTSGSLPCSAVSPAAPSKARITPKPKLPLAAWAPSKPLPGASLPDSRFVSNIFFSRETLAPLRASELKSFTNLIFLGGTDAQCSKSFVLRCRCSCHRRCTGRDTAPSKPRLSCRSSHRSEWGQVRLLTLGDSCKEGRSSPVEAALR